MERFQGAKWIAGDSEIGDNSRMLRREFSAKEGLKRATLYCCGLGYGVYTINGENVTDEVLVTPFTRYDRTVLYNTFDVTRCIRAGKNAIGVHLGNGFYNDNCPTWDFDKADWRSHPKLILELVLEYGDGSMERVVSDASWSGHSGPILYNHMRGGEVYDARLLEDGWDRPDFAGKWEPAFICRSPGGILRPAELPPIRIIERLPMREIEPGLYDSGVNISGWVRIRVRGKAGDTVSLRYAEYLNPDGTLNEMISLFTKGMLKHEDRYILRGSGTEEYAPSFVYHGFRYVSVRTDAELVSIETEIVHTDLRIVGEFECSDPMLNRIHEAARRATLNNYMGIPTDCPHREQNGWTGDALFSCEQSIMNYDMTPAYRKWMNDFKDVQRPDGQLPGIIPTSGWGFNWGNGPLWDGALIMIPYYTYQLTGDDSLIRQMWENMKRYMDFLSRMADAGIVNFGLQDWSAPKCAVWCPPKVTDTAWYYADAKVMSRCCALLGEPDPYRELADTVRAAYRREFLGDAELEKSQTFLACGLYWGMYEGEEIPQTAAKLAALVEENDGRIACGTHGTKCIFTALSENGYAELVYRMVTNPEMPSYRYWIDHGATTLCEQWGFDDDSRNHHMFSEVDYWFYRYVAGIRLSDEGLEIRPCFLKELDWVQAHRGDIEVRWNRTHLIVKAPVAARVFLDGQEYDVEPGEHCFPCSAT